MTNKIPILEGLNTTEWWVLQERIKAVKVDALTQRNNGPTCIMMIRDNTGQCYDIHFDLNGGSIFNPLKVRKL